MTNHVYHVRQFEDRELLDLARGEIERLPAEAWDRYESTFEAKLTLRDKRELPSWVEVILEGLEDNTALEEWSRVFGIELIADRWRHYTGVFRYLPGDHLGVHVDAGIHPPTGLRKTVTIVLYLGGAGALELWAGTSCVQEPPRIMRPDGSGRWFHSLSEPAPEPVVTACINAIAPTLGTMVAFANNDYAWHSAARNDGDTDRIVITVSYLSAEIDRFANRRQRAFFVPRPDEEWTPETYALRDLRADDHRYAEAYR